MSAKPVPEGQHSITPHLTVGDASKAIDYYKKAFGATEMQRMQGPDGKIMHATIKIGDTYVFLNDEYPEMGGKSPQTLGGSPVTINFYTPDVDQVFKAAVDAGGKIKMLLEDQFWGDRYGIVIDPFGHEWAIAKRIANYTDEELKKRGQEAMAQMAQMAQQHGKS